MLILYLFFSSKILDSGVDAIVNQVVNPKVKSLILPLVEETVYNFLQIEVPKRNLEGTNKYIITKIMTNTKH